MRGFIVTDDNTPTDVVMLRVLDGRSICYSSVQDVTSVLRGYDEALHPKVVTVDVSWRVAFRDSDLAAALA